MLVISSLFAEPRATDKRSRETTDQNRRSDLHKYLVFDLLFLLIDGILSGSLDLTIPNGREFYHDYQH